MAIALNSRPLTKLESFSIAEEFTLKIAIRNHSHSRLVTFLARVEGCAFVALFALADVIMHATIASIKFPLALIALGFRGCFHVTPDLHISSSLTHLIHVVYGVFNMAILPLLCLFNPDKAYRVAQRHEIDKPLDQPKPDDEKVIPKKIIDEQIKFKELKLKDEQKDHELIQLKQKTDHIKEQIIQSNKARQVSKDEMDKYNKQILKLKKDYKETEERSHQSNLALDQRIEELKMDKKNLEDQIKLIKQQVQQALPKEQFDEIGEKVKLAYKENNDNLELQLKNLKQDLLDINNKLELAEKKVQENKEDNEKAIVKLAKLETENNDLNAKTAEIELQKKALNEENQQIKNDINHKKYLATIEQKNEENLGLKKKIAEINKQLNN